MTLNVLDRGEGRPLLLLHGFTGSARSWSHQVEAWAPRFRVIAPDLLGHAGSASPADPTAYTLEHQAAGLADLLELLDAAPATVVGYSMGARLALVVALLHPGLAGALVLESPSAGIADGIAREQRRAADEQLATEIERDGIESFVDRWERMPLFASHARLSPDEQRRLRGERLGHDPHGLAACLRGAGQGAMTPLHDRLREIDVPALVLAGALDEAGVARGRSVAALMPAASFETVADAGHTPHLEQPTSFSTAVERFLASTALHAPH